MSTSESVECAQDIGLPWPRCVKFGACLASTKDCSSPVPLMSDALLLLSIPRVMAVARGNTEDSLVFCGLVGIMDPPRASAIAFADRMRVRCSDIGRRSCESSILCATTSAVGRLQLLSLSISSA